MDGVHTQQVHDERLDVQTRAWDNRLFWPTANLLDVTSSTSQTESQVLKSQTVLLTDRSQIKYDRQPNWKASLYWTASKQLRDGMGNYTLARSLGRTRGHSRQPFSPAQAQTTISCRQHRISSTNPAASASSGFPALHFWGRHYYARPNKLHLHPQGKETPSCGLLYRVLEGKGSRAASASSSTSKSCQ